MNRRDAAANSINAAQEFMLFQSRSPATDATIEAVTAGIDAARECVIACTNLRQVAEDLAPEPERVAYAVRWLIAARDRAATVVPPLALELVGAIPTTERIAGLEIGGGVFSYAFAAFHHAEWLLWQIGEESAMYGETDWRIARETLLGRPSLDAERLDVLIQQEGAEAMRRLRNSTVARSSDTCPERQGGKLAAVPSNGAEDDDAYVIASKLWPTKFARYADCRAFLARSSIRTKVKGQRRLIHAADWANHWAAVDKAAFAAMENCDGELVVPVTVDTESAIQEAADRCQSTQKVTFYFLPTLRPSH